MTPSSKKRVSLAGRSVLDYVTEEELREALMSVQSLSSYEGGPNSSPIRSQETHSNDWLLPVPDPEAEEQSIEGELQRLLVLKSYLILDAEKEEAFDRLTEQACHDFSVPISLVSLVDLGRQFFLSQRGNPEEVRETPRSVAFCAHTILNKNGIVVVKDAKKDERFRNSKLVLERPFLRFYAGAPLISPEGYKLGTFCVEGPDPRPEGLTEQEKQRLKDYAAKTMDLIVERRKVVQKRLSSDPLNATLHRHAAVTTNLGNILLRSGECFTAMKLFQESVQTLMLVEESQQGMPSEERQEQMRQLFKLLSNHQLSPESRRVLIQGVKALFQMFDTTQDPPATAKLPFGSKCHSRCIDESVPGLFTAGSKLKGVASRNLPSLVFGEPFKINMDIHDGAVDFRQFSIPMSQCSKATMFNMGLIHYHWGSPDSAVQFFDLAASLSSMTPSVLSFDPVVLACLNNMAQINLQYRRPNDAMEMLADALTRGNAALATMYGSAEYQPPTLPLQSRVYPPVHLQQQPEGDAPPSPTYYSSSSSSSATPTGNAEDIEYRRDVQRSTRLRRKLARTLLNMGHVHFYNCDYPAAMSTCKDALRLMHTNLHDLEVAAIWFNFAMLCYHQGDKLQALEYLDKYLELAVRRKGPHQLQNADAFHRKGQILFEIGQLYSSMKPLNEALRIRKLKLGTQHPSVAETLLLIGKVLQAREEYDFALNALQQCLDIQRKVADDSSFEVAQTLLEVGRAYHAQGHVKESLAVYSEVATLTRQFFGDRHPFVARIANIMGSLYLETGDIDASVAAYRDAMKIRLEHGLPVEFNVVQDKLVRVKLDRNPVAPMA